MLGYFEVEKDVYAAEDEIVQEPQKVYCERDRGNDVGYGGGGIRSDYERVIDSIDSNLLKFGQH